MRAAKTPVQYVVYTDEGHGLLRPENVQHWFAMEEAFLARYLGGRAEPAGLMRGHSASAR